MLSRNCISFEYLINPMLTYIFHVEKAFIWGMLANRGFSMPVEGAIVVIVGLTSSVEKGAEPR